MKLKIILIVIGLFLLSACQPATVNNYYLSPNHMLHPAMSPILPLDPGLLPAEIKCRITCFSHNAKSALYPLHQAGKPIYVKGSVMVPGTRNARNICRPFGYEKADISALSEFKDICKVFVKSCGNNCWAGGN